MISIVWTRISAGGMREMNHHQILKEKGLIRSQFLGGVAEKEGVAFFRELQFLHKMMTMSKKSL